MTDTLSLVKEKAEQVTISLAKRGITTIPSMRVCADLDVSGSMNMSPYFFYDKGIVEEVFKRLIGYALKFDDNGEIDVWAFDTSVRELPTAKTADYGSYITKNITKQWGRYGGGTRYAPPIRANVEFLFQDAKKPSGLAGMFSKKPAASQDPALVLFFTDGDANDEREAGEIMDRCWKENKPVYFHLIGIGTATRFEKLKWLADKYDNCGFLHLPSIELSDAQLYDALATDEFIAFLKKHGAH